METSNCFANLATNGAVFHSQESSITIRASDFRNNTATVDGGIADSYGSTIAIRECNFQDNFVDQSGGVLFSPFTEYSLNNIRIYDSNFTKFNSSLIGVVGIRTSTRHAVNEVYYITADLRIRQLSFTCTVPISVSVCHQFFELQRFKLSTLIPMLH